MVKQNDIRYNTESMINNILKAYNLRSENDFTDGLNWYSNARIECQAIAYEYNLSVNVVVAIVAVLSPSYGWDKNIEAALSIITGEGTTSAYGENVDKAKRILESGNISILSGNKVTRFYKNILGDSNLVTCDRWALRVAYGYNLNQFVASPTDKQYSLVSQAYTEASKIVGLTPQELQAITWLTARRLNDDGQVTL